MERELSFRALSETLHHLFDPAKVNQLAYETGFCQRRSKLQGNDFFSSCVFFSIQLRPKHYLI
jgi:hypothetical protein